RVLPGAEGRADAGRPGLRRHAGGRRGRVVTSAATCGEREPERNQRCQAESGPPDLHHLHGNSRLLGTPGSVHLSGGQARWPAAWPAALGFTISPAVAPKPPVVWKPIPYGPRRKAEMAAYAEKHYGIHSWRLRPKVIVEHYTASNSFSAAWNTFASNTPDPELRELPGDCAHFVIDRNGRIYQLARLDVMCRDTVGL